MVCKACKYEFCWLCMQKFTRNHYQYRAMNSCGGQMFSYDRASKCKIICRMIYSFIMFLLFPVLLILFFLFIIPLWKFMDEYRKIRTKTVRQHRLHPHDNRFAGRDRKQSIKNIGICNLLLYTLLSIIISPITFLLMAIVIVIILLIWIVLLFVVIYFFFYSLCKICCFTNRVPVQNPAQNPEQNQAQNQVINPVQNPPVYNRQLSPRQRQRDALRHLENV